MATRAATVAAAPAIPPNPETRCRILEHLTCVACCLQLGGLFCAFCTRQQRATRPHRDSSHMNTLRRCDVPVAQALVHRPPPTHEFACSSPPRRCTSGRRPAASAHGLPRRRRPLRKGSSGCVRHTRATRVRSTRGLGSKLVPIGRTEGRRAELARRRGILLVHTLYRRLLGRPSTHRRRARAQEAIPQVSISGDHERCARLGARPSFHHARPLTLADVSVIRRIAPCMPG